MSSFFEKLKKGMGIEEPLVEEVEEKREEIVKKPKKPRIKKVSVPKIKKLEIKPPPEVKKEKTEPLIESAVEPQKNQREEPEAAKKEVIEEPKEKWPDFGSEPEGQLAIDVYQTKTDLVIQSAIAGVKSENLDISIEKDIVSIKGAREKPFKEEGDYFAKECFWGPFSREIILPAEVDPNRAEASMKDGVLIIRIPKILRDKRRKIAVRV